MVAQTYVVHAEWDAEANYWYVSDSNVPGLATGADSVPELLVKLRVMVPELITLNGLTEPFEGDVPFELFARYQETMRLSIH